MNLTQHPLTWPVEKARTERFRRRRSNFKTNFAKARDNALREVQRLGGIEPILSTNIPLRMDGLPYSNMRTTNDDPGVALYFERKKKRLVFACDLYVDTASNMHAIALTIAALRGIARWGTGDMLEAAVSGFAALPEKAAGRSWWDRLNVAHDATEEQITARFRELAKIVHPDVGGGTEAWHEINEAYQQGLTVARGRQ